MTTARQKRFRCKRCKNVFAAAADTPVDRLVCPHCPGTGGVNPTGEVDVQPASVFNHPPVPPMPGAPGAGASSFRHQAVPQGPAGYAGGPGSGYGMGPGMGQVGMAPGMAAGNIGTASTGYNTGGAPQSPLSGRMNAYTGGSPVPGMGTGGMGPGGMGPGGMGPGGMGPAAYGAAPAQQAWGGGGYPGGSYPGGAAAVAAPPAPDGYGEQPEAAPSADPNAEGGYQEGWVGRLIGNYRVMQELGRGAAGVVYKAVDENLGRQVAIKCLSSSSSNAPKRFEKEAMFLAQLSHPNILPVYYYDQFEGTPYLVCELMTGGSLADKVKRDGPMQVIEAVEAIRDVSRGLHLAHQQNIIHRDIKPANIMLGDNGIAKLADFGLARATDDQMKLTKTGYIVGSAGFVAPEVCKGQKASPSSDIYALGCSLYFLLTGELPFNAPNGAQVIRMHIKNPFPEVRDKNPGVPASVSTVMRRSCAKEPAERYPDALAFADALDASLYGDTGGEEAQSPTGKSAADISSELLNAVGNKDMLVGGAGGKSGYGYDTGPSSGRMSMSNKASVSTSGSSGTSPLIWSAVLGGVVLGLLGLLVGLLLT